MMSFAVVVGIGAALGTIIFVRLILIFYDLFFVRGAEVFWFLGSAYVIVLPMLGGLLVGPLVYFVAPEAKGHGVPEVITAIATRGGRIRPIVVLVKALGSAITIGSGGSVGREGPIVQIGAALGSSIGQFFKMNERRIINLLAAGAAAGIAATFNAPIAGVIFSLEVILGDFGIQAFTAIVIAAVTASVVSRAVLGDFPAFPVPTYTLKSPWELLLYLGLGIVAGLVAMLFVKTLYWFEDTFDAWHFPPYLKPAVGGLMLGVVGFFLPQVFGTGFETIAATLNGNLALGLMFVLIFAKILATSLTLGSGSSGGVFAPALFIGAVMGGAYGDVAHLLLPDITATSGAYAMVGMAAVFAGAARAPITAIIILFEMTQDYRIVLPLMFAVVVATVLAQKIEPESIYTIKLKRRGIDVRAKRQVNLMQSILVEEAMTPLSEMTTVRPGITVKELARLFQATSHHGFVVLNENGELFGVVALSDLEEALRTEQADTTVGDICTREVLTAFSDETLDDALRHFGALDVGRIPVVERRNPKRVLGVLRRGDIIQAYAQALGEKQDSTQRMERLRLESATGSELIELVIARGDAADGKMLKQLALPPECVMISIWRGSKLVFPRGETQLLAGDRVVVLARGIRHEDLEALLRRAPQLPM